MASMARSGETLLLKLLSAHPRIKIVHNLNSREEAKDLKCFEFLKSYSSKTINRKEGIVKHYKLNRNDILLLKQGVWKHPYKFNGFVLSRNPVSIYASLKTYDKRNPKYDAESNFWFENQKRLKRWLMDIEPGYVKQMEVMSPVEQFVNFYNIRMGDLFKLAVPIVRYEDLVIEPELALKKCCKYLGVRHLSSLANSHLKYNKGEIGHGLNDLSKPIDKSSLDKYKEVVTDFEFRYIKKHALEVYSKYGYKINDGEVMF